MMLTITLSLRYIQAGAAIGHSPALTIEAMKEAYGIGVQRLLYLSWT